MRRRPATGMRGRVVREPVDGSNMGMKTNGREGTVEDAIIGIPINRTDAVRQRGGWVHQNRRWGSRDDPTNDSRDDD